VTGGKILCCEIPEGSEEKNTVTNESGGTGSGDVPLE
jgi:hypothetical protein